MYLWQIRHIPNSWRNLFSFSLLLATGLMAAWAVAFGPGQAQGQSDSKKESAKSAAVDPAAAEFIKKVHDSLYARSSIKADIEQTVTMGTQQFQCTGQYLSSGPKLRLEYVIKPDQGVSGSILEVCDGKELWSLIKILDNKRVTHRDVQQIKAAISDTRTVTDAVLTAELGLGGLPGLIASLERTMVFDTIKEERGEAGQRTIIQGKWKSDFESRWPKGKDGSLPGYIPDSVRIFVDQSTMFPQRIVYIKAVTEKDKKVLRPLVSLTFTNVEFDNAISDQEFTFVPPEGVVPEDNTRQYLDRIKKAAEDAAKGSANAPAASKK